MRGEAIGKDCVSPALVGTVASPRKLYASLGREGSKSNCFFALIWNTTD